MTNSIAFHLDEWSFKNPSVGFHPRMYSYLIKFVSRNVGRAVRALALKARTARPTPVLLTPKTAS